MNDTLIRLTGLWENLTKDGRTYYSGVLGGCKVLLFKDRDPAEGAPQWSLMGAPRPEKATTTTTRPAETQAYPQHRSATPRPQAPKGPVVDPGLNDGLDDFFE